MPQQISENQNQNHAERDLGVCQMRLAVFARGYFVGVLKGPSL
jgi:hypothetical protein